MLSLPDLPLDVLEAICRPLQLEDRLALTSCCRTLWARPDVAGSGPLWGSLGRTIDLGSTEEPLAGFFTRHAAGLRTLEFWLLPSNLLIGSNLNKEWVAAELAALLDVLADSELVDLAICSPDGLGSRAGAIQPLSRLTALTRLQVLGALEAAPAHLSALQRLAHLDLGSNWRLGYSDGPAVFQSLAPLLTLTYLSLASCNVAALPPQLPLLTRLQVLLLAGSYRLGAGGEAAFEGLRQLTVLQSLNLFLCGLQAVPRQLAALPALEALELGENTALGEKDTAEAFPVLCQLTGLTSLSIRRCHIRGVPPQVAALTGLLELDLSGNEALGRAGEDAFQPLLHLSVLTSLMLRNTGLCSLPPQLSALRALRVLDVSNSYNPGWRAPEMWLSVLREMGRRGVVVIK